MITEPIRIAGVDGAVIVTTDPVWGRHTVTVGGLPARKIAKRRYVFPGTQGGDVEATVRNRFGDPYPVVEVGGEPHRTGPAVPGILRVLALVPLALALLGGALGGGLGGVAVVANLAVARTRLPSAAKALIMLVLGVAALLAYYAIAVALFGTNR